MSTFRDSRMTWHARGVMDRSIGRLLLPLLFSLCLLAGVSCKSLNHSGGELNFATTETYGLCKDLTAFIQDSSADEKQVVAEIKRWGTEDYPLSAGMFAKDLSSMNQSIDSIKKAGDKIPYDLQGIEYAVVRFYTSQGHIPINAALAAGECEEVVATTRVLASGLNKLPAVRGILYRGTRIDQDQFEQSWVVGKTVTSSMFISVSADLRIARAFAKMGAYGRDKIDVLFEIRKGSGSLVDPISINQGEREILLTPGMKFRVDAIEAPKNDPYFKSGKLTRVILTQITVPPNKIVEDLRQTL